MAVQTLKLAAFILPSSYYEEGSAPHTNLRVEQTQDNPITGDKVTLDLQSFH